MEQFKKSLTDLQSDMVGAMKSISKLLLSEGRSTNVVARQMDDYLCEVENLCVKSRMALEKYRPLCEPLKVNAANEIVEDICGNAEVTNEGWVHITLNTLLPNCKHRISGYLGDTIARLIRSCGYKLPYFETAFLAIVEYCNFENHNALDNDNKGWKMIPNALKGRVIEDDTQFHLSIGLFTKLSEDARCEIYVMPPEDVSDFTYYLFSDTL